MNGLKRIPNHKNLEKAYSVLQSQIQPDTETLALYGQWSRFDPRLAEQLIFSIAKYWKNLQPLALSESIKQQPWPSAMGVILEFAELVLLNDRQFHLWKNLVMGGIECENFASFFIGTRSFASPLQLDDARCTIKPYLKWGYIGREFLVPKTKPKNTLISKKRRYLLLKELMKEKARFTVNEYRAKLNYMIGLRQAQKDLENHPSIRKAGNTRARFYRGR